MVSAFADREQSEMSTPHPCNARLDDSQRIIALYQKTVPRIRNAPLCSVDASLIAHTTFEPALAINESMEIVSWNSGIEKMLGYPSRSVLGKRCYEVLRGRDVFGNRYCNQECPLVKMVRRGEAVHGLELEVLGATGEHKRANVLTLAVRGRTRSEFTLLQTFGQGRRPARPTPPWARAISSREKQILDLLAEGLGTSGIARSLSITTTTTRTHIQNLLRKLNVHSRVEAVALANRAV